MSGNGGNDELGNEELSKWGASEPPKPPDGVVTILSQPLVHFMMKQSANGVRFALPDKDSLDLDSEYYVIHEREKDIANGGTDYIWHVGNKERVWHKLYAEEVLEMEEALIFHHILATETLQSIGTDVALQNVMIAAFRWLQKKGPISKVDPPLPTLEESHFDVGSRDNDMHFPALMERPFMDSSDEEVPRSKKKRGTP